MKIRIGSAYRKTESDHPPDLPNQTTLRTSHRFRWVRTASNPYKTLGGCIAVSLSPLLGPLTGAAAAATFHQYCCTPGRHNTAPPASVDVHYKQSQSSKIVGLQQSRSPPFPSPSPHRHPTYSACKPLSFHSLQSTKTGSTRTRP